MESITLALMERIKEKMPQLRYIDEDYGQLDFRDDQYPVIAPAVLINIDETDWTTESAVRPTIQSGSTQLTLKLVLECYDDTHIDSTTEHKIEERAEQARQLFRAVQGFKLNSKMSPMTRIKSRDYAVGGNLKVYETVFEFLQRELLARE
ncbi:MAG: hypothetical protein II986_09600 [Alistipes sp.]|nr:hypothetical protein [Alistipes sp.]